MNKKLGFYRFDVWYAFLDKFGVEEHYVVIISNYKNNTKSRYVNACLLTTKLKPHPAHVDLVLNGTKAQICCEDIFTLDKRHLVRKVKRIQDTFLQLEINKCLEMQLELLPKYQRYTEKQLENFFMSGVDDIESEEIFLKLKHEVYKFYLNKDFKECLFKADELIDKVNSSYLSENNEYLWYGYYYKSLMYIKLNQYSNALTDAKNSLKFVGKVSDLNKNYAFSMWLLGNIYENMENSYKATQIYKVLSKYYQKIGYTNLRISTLFNQAKINKNINRMEHLIKILKSIEVNNNRTDLTKENLLMNMENELRLISK